MAEDKSLLSLFLPPRDNVRGIFGFLCGYSGGNDFLESALENFTCLEAGVRGSRGMLNMILFLDKHRKQISSVTGLFHAMYSGNNKDFSLMHAKVGFLAFGRDQHNPFEYIRIFVSTGNWTRQGMIDSLDLVWTLDLDLNQKNSRSDLVEVRKVLNFFQNLSEYYPLLNLGKEVLNQLDQLLPNDFRPIDFTRARFFSSFDEQNGKKISMLKSISSRFVRQDGMPRFNILFCGSGFFEEVTEGGDLQVFDALEKELYPVAFTKTVEGYAIINRQDLWRFKSLKKSNNIISWNVRQARDYKTESRFLHAKYIFGGFLINGKYSQGKLYLGSGNLSKKGMLYHLGMPDANIEAGVVIELRNQIETDLDQALCIGADDYSVQEIDDSKTELSDFVFSDIVEYACPLRAIVNFDVFLKKGDIEWSEKPQDCYFYGEDEREIFYIKVGQEHFELPKTCKLGSQLTIFTSFDKKSFYVPIITKEKEFCLTPPPELDTQSVLNMLMEYPDIGAGVDYDEDGEPVEKPSTITAPFMNVMDDKSNRSLSMAMELVEAIARKNHVTQKELLMGWFSTLEFTLIKCLKQEEKDAFKSLNVNFLETLKKRHFAPYFEELENPELKKRYLQVVNAIASDWGLL